MTVLSLFSQTLLSSPRVYHAAPNQAANQALTARLIVNTLKPWSADRTPSMLVSHSGNYELDAVRESLRSFNTQAHYVMQFELSEVAGTPFKVQLIGTQLVISLRAMRQLVVDLPEFVRVQQALVEYEHGSQTGLLTIRLLRKQRRLRTVQRWVAKQVASLKLRATRHADLDQRAELWF